MMNKLMTPVLIGAVVLFGGLMVITYNNCSDSLIDPEAQTPKAFIPPIDASVPTDLRTATFALGCFWGPDSIFGSTPGVVRTRVGYTGGVKEDPTYRSLGGHTETVQIDYDPTEISYSELLDIFWRSHAPEHRSWSGQYKSIIFYHSEDERQLAHETKREREVEQNKTLYTEIKPYVNFYLAEEYHQKYRLQQEKELMKEFKAMYPEFSEFVNSTAAARVNGFVAGYGELDVLQKELSSLGLTEKGEKLLIGFFNERKLTRFC